MGELALEESERCFFVGVEWPVVVDNSSSCEVEDTLLGEVRGSHAEAGRSSRGVFCFQKAGKRDPEPLLPSLLSGGGEDFGSALLHGND